MASHTMLLQTRNSVETVLRDSTVHSLNKGSKRNYYQEKPTLRSHSRNPLDKRSKRESFSLKPTSASDASNFFSSTDWVPFEESENGGFFHCSVEPTVVFSPTYPHKNDWLCINLPEDKQRYQMREAYRTAHHHDSYKNMAKLKPTKLSRPQTVTKNASRNKVLHSVHNVNTDVASKWVSMAKQKSQPALSPISSSNPFLRKHETKTQPVRSRQRREPRETSRRTRRNHTRSKQTSSNTKRPSLLAAAAGVITCNNKSSYLMSSEVLWRSAKDPKSGRTYYYNVKTRETQWRKPMELATDEERAEMEAKEKQQKAFFAQMEANILKNITKTPTVTPAPKEIKKKVSIPRPNMVRTISSMDENVLRDLTRVPSVRRGLKSSNENSRRSSLNDSRRSSLDEESTKSLNPGELHHMTQLDTLMEASREFDESTTQLFGASVKFSNLEYSHSPTPPDTKLMGEDLEEISLEELQALTALEHATQEMKMSTPTPNSMPAGLDFKDAMQSEEKVEPNENEKNRSLKSLARPKMSKRNTCGTLYVGTTMSAPDKDATIKCVCGVYRAHILQSAKEDADKKKTDDCDNYIIFNDYEVDRDPIIVDRSPLSIQNLSLENADEKSAPTLDEITGFYRDVFRRSQMETDCIIMSLIYVERLIKETDGKLRPRCSNWRSILFSCMVLSSKVWDDLSMWNADFSQTCPAGVTLFNLARINELEIAVLTALKYNVKVKSSEYAKYYFLLRSMIIKSGLGSDDLSSMAPLDVEGAKKLESLSSDFSHRLPKLRRPSRLRATKSLDSDTRRRIIQAQATIEENGLSDSPPRESSKVNLEELVNM